MKVLEYTYLKLDTNERKLRDRAQNGGKRGENNKLGILLERRRDTR
jgi:hypothetical protein